MTSLRLGSQNRLAVRARSWCSASRLWPFLLLLAAPAAAGRDVTLSPDFIRAVSLANSGEHPQARDLFLQILRQEPDNVGAAERYVRESIGLHDVPGGMLAMRQLAHEHPRATAPLGAMALFSEKTHEWDEARQLWLKTIQLGSRHPEHFYGMVGACQRLNTNDQSEAVLDSLAAVTPGDALVLYGRGVRAWLMHDLNGATDLLQQAIAADPDLFEAAECLGDIQHQNLAPTASVQTWNTALKRAGELGDREAQFLLLDRLGESYWNALDAQTVPTLEEAVPLGEAIGEYDQVGIMRNRLCQVELTLGHLDSSLWWGEEQVRHDLQRGDTLEAAVRLSFVAGTLDYAGDRSVAAGLYEQALRLEPIDRHPERMVTSANRLADLLLRLGDGDGAALWAGRVQDYHRRNPNGRIGAQDLAQVDLVQADLALFAGRLARADTIYQRALSEPVSSVFANLKGEAGIGRARCLRLQNDLTDARSVMERARMDVSVSKDTTLAGLLDLEDLALLLAEGNRTAVESKSREILARTALTLPRGLQPEAALYLARLELLDHPDEALGDLLLAWRLAEKEREHSTSTPLPEGLLPDPEEPLERLAQFFAQLALRPGEKPDWTWKAPKGMSHLPDTPAGILAARWSYFFAERRAARILEYNLSGYGGALPPTAGAGRWQLWDQVAQRLQEQAPALLKGKLPKDAPAPEAPLLQDLTGPVRETLARNVPEYTRLPWLMTPAETSDLERALQKSHETIVRTLCGQSLTLVYILTQDRIRITALPVERAALATAVQSWVPYRAFGCTTPSLDKLPTDFEAAGQLFNELLGPVGETADLSHTIWIAADGPLWVLPFESLSPRGGQATAPDKKAVMEQPSAVPIALDHYPLAYVLDPGALLAGAPAAGAPVPGAARFVLPSFPADGAAPEGPEFGPYWDQTPVSASALRQPPCEPQAADLDRLKKEAAAPPEQLQPNEAELARLAPTGTTVFFCPEIDHPGHPWEGGLVLGGKQEHRESGLERWTDLAHLHGQGCLVLGEASSTGQSPDLGALCPSRWGGEITTPALYAAFAGFGSMVQTLWNAGEAGWIPLAGCLHRPEGPQPATFLAERQRLRGDTISAGPGHTLALGHPFFSCATRWWQLAPPVGP